MAQGTRWKQAAEAEGHSSVGRWLADAADAYLKAQAAAGQPVSPLGWSRGSFRVVLETGETEVYGFASPPFGTFRGLSSSPVTRGQHRRLGPTVDRSDGAGKNRRGDRRKTSSGPSGSARRRFRAGPALFCHGRLSHWISV